MFADRNSQKIILAIFFGVLLGCLCGSIAIGLMVAPEIARVAFAPTVTLTPTATVFIRPTITLAPTMTRTSIAPVAPTATPIPSETVTSASPTMTRTPVPSRTPHVIVYRFLVSRPVPPTATGIIPALTYLYGTTSGGAYDVHHGEEFVNPTGTPLLAVADGTVVTAGNDAQRLCGDDNRKTCGRDINFYGNVVVIRLDQTYDSKTVYVLYGHMNRINVDVGARVRTGDVIGEVGMTGIALGPHVHFEVRLVVNDYAHTYNPILWMTPLAGRGALTGHYLDAKGNPVVGASIGLWRADPETFLYSSETYGRDDFPAVNSASGINDNFAFPDLVPGDYIVRVTGQQYAQRVTVEAGKLAFVDLGGQ
jgi:murein DD-endopeptidase MepM/ murein hydrolase activator NlpD